MNLSDRTKAILHGKTDLINPGDNPVQHNIDSKGAFLRFDTIKVRQANDDLGGVVMSLWWRGHEVAWERIEGATLTDGVELRGVEARSRIDTL